MVLATPCFHLFVTLFAQIAVASPLFIGPDSLRSFQRCCVNHRSLPTSKRLNSYMEHGRSRKFDPKQCLNHSGLASSQLENDHADGAANSRSQRRVCIMDKPLDEGDDRVYSAIDSADILSRIAYQTSLPVYSKMRDVPEDYTHCLSIVPYESTYAIAISSMQENSSQNNKKRRRLSKKKVIKPFYIDLCPPGDSRLIKRTRGQSGTDLLIKAVAPARGSQEMTGAIVYDLTAGFGQDAILLACAGASKVHMIERDPVIATLLDDALRRLRSIAQNGDIKDSRTRQASMLSQKLTLHVAEGIDVARNVSVQCASSKEKDLQERPDICYLDPMFPPRTKSAAVKKNIQLLHDLLDSQRIEGDQPPGSSNEGLLEAAIEAARARVVVKRPISAKPLGDRKPSYDIRGSVNRWDVYIK